MRGPILILTIGLLLNSAAEAGRGCEPYQPDGTVIARAAQMAVAVDRELADFTVDDAGLIARVGTDLSEHGLHYSHVAFIWRPEVNGPLRVDHLLNHCEAKSSALYREGLAHFFLDGPQRFDTRVVRLAPDMSRAVSAFLRSGRFTQLHDPRYNVLAHHTNKNSQNSTQFILESLVAAANPQLTDRRAVQTQVAQSGYQADTIRLKLHQRLFGSFKANLNLLDQPRRNRIRNRFEVMSVRSLIDYSKRQGWTVTDVELIHPCPIAAIACGVDMISQPIQILPQS